jgi:hypothetical protein
MKPLYFDAHSVCRTGFVTPFETFEITTLFSSSNVMNEGTTLVRRKIF